jgi:uncharacterized protein with von Willebrand factor type A (vWA) domain
MQLQTLVSVRHRGGVDRRKSTDGCRRRSTLHRFARLQRDAPSREIYSRDFALTQGTSYLFKGLSLHRPMQSLRAHRRVASSQIDIRATLRATIAAGGRVQMKYGRRPQLPDYLILCEQFGSHDHLTQMGKLILARMRSEQVHFAAYTFSADPRCSTRCPTNAMRF